MRFWLKMTLQASLFGIPAIGLAVFVILSVAHRSPAVALPSPTVAPMTTGLTKAPIPFSDPIQDVGNLRSTRSTHSSPIKPNHVCPDGKFRCSIKSNSLYQHRPRGGLGFVCINPRLVCDGTQDCANGEDEINCRLPVSVPTDSEQDCYLCRGTAGVCVPRADVCDGIPDCPLEDDESHDQCISKHPLESEKTEEISKLGVKQFDGGHPMNISDSYELSNGSQASDFRAQQTGNANISIVNNNSLGAAGEGRTDSAGGGSGGPQAPNAGTGAVSGVGFMFRVDNFVIYNSQVKMFNQDSENLSLAGNKKGSFLDKIKEHQNPGNFTNGPPPGATSSEASKESENTSSTDAPPESRGL